MVVIASIHQPNWESIALFDSLLLLAQGRTMYFGPVRACTASSIELSTALICPNTDALDAYLTDALDYPVPTHANPTDHALDLINTEFGADPARGAAHVRELAQRWADYAHAHPALLGSRRSCEWTAEELEARGRRRTPGTLWRRAVEGFKLGVYRTGVLMERNAVNYSRNLLAYGVRLGMYRKWRKYPPGDGLTGSPTTKWAWACCSPPSGSTSRRPPPKSYVPSTTSAPSLRLT